MIESKVGSMKVDLVCIRVSAEMIGGKIVYLAALQFTSAIRKESQIITVDSADPLKFETGKTYTVTLY